MLQKLGLTRWQTYTLLCLFVLSTFIHFFRLNTIPSTLTHDEMVYAVQARSLATNGNSLDGKQSWFSLFPTDPLYAEWPASIMAFSHLILQHPIAATHAPSAVMGTLLPFLFGWLIYGIWRNKNVALWAVFFSLFNPLLWQLGRLGYDPFYSLFFYIAGGAILLNTQRHTKLLSLPFFVLGFFQYQGFKLLLLPWIATLIGMQLLAQTPWKNLRETANEVWKKQKLLPFIAPVATLFMLVIAYGVLLLPQQNVGNRLSQTFWNETETYTLQVNNKRRQALPVAFDSLITNKGTEMLDFVVYRVFDVFHWQEMFRSLDASVNGFFAWQYGRYYVLDALLIGVGLYALIIHQKTRPSLAFLCLAILGLTFPSVINTMSEWHEFRSLLSFTLILAIISWGAEELRKNRLVFYPVAGAYMLGTLLFAHHYFFRYPIYTADDARFIERVVSRYIELSAQKDPQRKIVVYADGTNGPDFFWKSHLLYSRQITPENKDGIAQSLQNGEWKIGNVTFKEGCVVQEDLQNSTLIFVADAQICSDDKTVMGDAQAMNVSSARFTPPILSLPAMKDSGEIFRIQNDILCDQNTLSTYISPKTIAELQLEDQNAQAFCRSWVTYLPTNNINSTQ